MKIKEISIDLITPYANNPRNNEKAVEYVRESIEQFGFKVPIVLNGNYEIVCGHTRYEAAKLLGISEVPCVIADDLTDEQIKMFRLADNKVAEMSSWDFELLAPELEAIKAAEIDVEMLGFVEEQAAPIKNFDNSEIYGEDFNDEKYKYECPECGFHFN